MWQMIWVGATSARRSAMALGGVSGFLAERFWPLQNSPHVATVYRCEHNPRTGERNDGCGWPRSQNRTLILAPVQDWRMGNLPSDVQD
jgi:hypothetical protein